MDLRRVEIVSAVLKLGEITYYAGDVKSLPRSEADSYIALGWAKDHDTGETGERVPGAQRLNVDSTVITPAA